MRYTQCRYCGGQFADNMMADLTICFSCKKHEMEKMFGEEVFIDSLGIAWTKKELDEAGGWKK